MRCIELIPRGQSEGVGLFIERDFMLPTVVLNDDPGKPVLALEAQKVVLVGDDRQDQPSRLVIDQVAPVVAAGGRQRGFHDLEVFRTVRIGENDQAVALMLDIIFVTVLARRDQLERASRLMGVDHVNLGGLVVVRRDQDEISALGLADTDEETRVFFFIDQDVILGRRADLVPEHSRGPVIFVEADIENMRRIRRPHD